VVSNARHGRIIRWEDEREVDSLGAPAAENRSPSSLLSLRVVALPTRILYGFWQVDR